MPTVKQGEMRYYSTTCENKERTQHFGMEYSNEYNELDKIEVYLSVMQVETSKVIPQGSIHLFTFCSWCDVIT